MARIEIRRADMAHFSVAPEIIERSKRLQPARLGVVPPVELHQVERINPQSTQGPLDDRPYVARGDPRQNVEVRHEFGVNPKPPRRLDPARRQKARTHLAVKLLDPGIDVGAIEGEDAGVEGGDEIVERCGAIDRPMAAGELPAAADDAGDRIIRRKLEGLDAAHATL